ncbi:MAG: hypothetical protein MUP98_01290 [Candidatus Aminicenantes bacterium]|nr:hypothetical protein [Candidatus Aminicenantes bacterium]
MKQRYLDTNVCSIAIQRVSEYEQKNFGQEGLYEMKIFARLTGHNDVHGLSTRDLMTVNSEISNFTDIEHV